MNWLREHWRALQSALARIRSTPGGFVFNVVVIALALVLPLTGLTVLENLRPVARDLAVEPELSVFLSTDVARSRAQAIAGDIRQQAQQLAVPVQLEFIDRDQALASMKAHSGLHDVVTALGSNPLPDAYVVRVAGGADSVSPGRITQLSDALGGIDGVDTVQLDSVWVKRLAALVDLAGVVLWLLALTLCGVVLAVVFNTIRLQAYTQMEEISVARLLGATDAYVSRPFYYLGGLLGLCAGVVALLAVAAGLATINISVIALAKLYGSSFSFSAPDARSCLLLLTLSVALGVIGAGLSVRRALKSGD
ncbi:MAG: permease-like cell division protein FtsX [Burkholderiales bacterium]|nr:permease-like cell division protein FtsX [Burkholderiales bacterium]